MKEDEGARRSDVATLALDIGRQHAAGVVAAIGLLDLDHIGTHVGQHAGAGRSSHDMGQVQHAHADKGAFALGLRHFSLLRRLRCFMLGN